MKPLKWEKIDISTHLTNETTSFHVDTRHFVSMYTIEPLERVECADDAYYSKFNKLYDMMHNEDEEIDEKYLIEEDRIVPFVFSIREMQKLNNAIVMKFEVEGCKWCVKYLRFYKYKNGKYVVTNDCTPIEWREMTVKSFKCN